MPRGSVNYLHTAQDGTVSAAFPGGVEVQAINGAIPLDPPSARAVRWTRQADGALVAFVVGAENGTLSQAGLGAVAPLGARVSRFNLNARSAGASEAELQLGDTNAPQRTLIMDDTRNSAFIQNTSVRRTMLGFPLVLTISLAPGQQGFFSNVPTGLPATLGGFGCNGLWFPMENADASPNGSGYWISWTRLSSSNVSQASFAAYCFGPNAASSTLLATPMATYG